MSLYLCQHVCRMVDDLPTCMKNLVMYGMVWYGSRGCPLSQKATSVTLKNRIAGLDVAQLTP